MAKNDEMNEDETDALLRDLSSRASGGQSTSVEDDDEDVEAFLKRLEAEESEAPAQPEARPVATKSAAVDDRFVGLKEAPKAEMVKAPETAASKPEPKASAEAKKAQAEPVEAGGEVSAEKKAAKPAGRSTGAKVAVFLLRAALVTGPFLLATWLTGAYLAQWVSAGWLVALMAMVPVLALSLGLRHAVKRGAYRWWLVGVGLVLSVALIAPMPSTAARVISAYGHWPMSAVSVGAGWGPNHVTVQVSQWFAEKVAGLLDAGSVGAGYQLGTERPLDDVPKTEEAKPEPPKPDEAKPEETAPE